MEEYQDFEEFIRLLNKHKVEYLIVGGYAVTFHSRPRLTEDLDIWINRTKSNSGRIFKAVKEFWFGEIELKPEDFLNEDLIFQIGYKPVRIDILTSLVGLNFNESYQKSLEGLFYGKVNARYLDKESLIKNKTLAGRRKDFEGINWIKDSSKKRKK